MTMPDELAVLHDRHATTRERSKAARSLSILSKSDWRLQRLEASILLDDAHASGWRRRGDSSNRSPWPRRRVGKAKRSAAKHGRRLRIMFADEARFGRMNQ